MTSELASRRHSWAKIAVLVVVGVTLLMAATDGRLLTVPALRIHAAWSTVIIFAIAFLTDVETD